VSLRTLAQGALLPSNGFQRRGKTKSGIHHWGGSTCRRSRPFSFATETTAGHGSILVGAFRKLSEAQESTTRKSSPHTAVRFRSCVEAPAIRDVRGDWDEKATHDQAPRRQDHQPFQGNPGLGARADGARRGDEASRVSTTLVRVTFPHAGPSPSTYPTAAGKKSISRLVDAFSLVVMHPVRRVGQALDAVELSTSSQSGSARSEPR
jgi:hypothetical protein